MLIDGAPKPQDPGCSLLERQHKMAQEVARRVGVAKARPNNCNNHRRRAHFLVGDLVWVRAHPLSKALDSYSSKLAPEWSGPARVRRKLGPINYRVKWEDSTDKVEHVNVVNLKPFFGSQPQVPRAGGGDLCDTAT